MVPGSAHTSSRKKESSRNPPNESRMEEGNHSFSSLNHTTPDSNRDDVCWWKTQTPALVADSPTKFLPSPSVTIASKRKKEEEEEEGVEKENNAAMMRVSDCKNNSFSFLSLLLLEEIMKSSWRKVEALSIAYSRRSRDKESSSPSPLMEEEKKKKKKKKEEGEEEEEERRRQIYTQHSPPLTSTSSSAPTFSSCSSSSAPRAAATTTTTALYSPSSTIPSRMAKTVQTPVSRGSTPQFQTTPTFPKTKEGMPATLSSLPFSSSSSSFLYANHSTSSSSSFSNNKNSNSTHLTRKGGKAGEEGEGKLCSRSTSRASNTNTNMLKTQTEPNVLYPKEIHHITDLSIHVRRLEEAYENLLFIHREHMKSLSMLNQNPHPQNHNKEKEEEKWRNKIGKSSVEAHHFTPSPAPPSSPVTSTNTTTTTTTKIGEEEGGKERGIQRGGRRKGADGHPSYVTHREVTLLRASLEATKCIAQQWIRVSTNPNVEHTLVSNFKVRLGDGGGGGEEEEEEDAVGMCSSEVVEEGKVGPGGGGSGEYRRKRRRTMRPPSLFSPLSSSPPPPPPPSPTTTTSTSARTSGAQTVEVALSHIEAMAAELEDEVGDSMLAHMMDPAFDIELPSLYDSFRYGKNKKQEEEEEKEEGGGGRWKKRVQSQLKTCWRIRKRVGVGVDGKHLDPHNGEEKEEEEKKKKKKDTIVITPTFPSSKAHAYGSHICVNASTRRTLGFSPSTPSTAPWPSYWRMLVDTPWEGRLQALTVGFFNFFVCCPLCVLISLLLLLFASWWVKGFILTYAVYMFSPLGKPKFPVHPWRWYQSLAMWRYFRDYFPVRQVIPPEVQQQFDPSRTYLFGYHPHAVHAFGAVATFGGEANGLSSTLPGLEFHLQTLRINFFIPFWRELCLFIGLGDASSESIRRTLRSGPGQCVVLAIGGAEESILSRPRTNDLVLRKRKGFVKMALETGSPLVPVYGFGENNSYESLSCVDHPTYFSLERLIKRYTRLTLPGIAGRGPFRVRPLPRPIFVVFGPPIEVPEIPFPTSEDIEFYHQKYMDSLLALYKEYCGVYDVGCRGIRFLE